MEIFVINLDRRPDRLAAMTKMMDGLGLNFHRVPAIDGRSFNVWQHCSIVKTAIYYDLKFPTPGTVACMLSHRLVWAEMIKRQVKQAVVFEDDVVPTQFDPAILDLDLAAAGLEQLRLEQWQIWTGKAKLATEEFAIPLLGRQAVGVPTAGTGCYILTLSGAEKLHRAKGYWFTIDHFDVWERLYGLKTAVLRPTMFTQADPISDIDLGPGQPNELLPNVIKSLFEEPRPTFAEGAKRIGNWALGAILDVRALIGSSLVYLPKLVLFKYEILKADLRRKLSRPSPAPTD